MSDSRDPHDHEVPLKVIDRRWWVQQNETADAGPTASEDWQPGKPTYVEQLESQLSEKDRQLQELVAKYRDASHEFDEARARQRKDIARAIERGRRAMLVELLEVIDNLDRAIDAARGASNPEVLVQGVEMVRGLFLAKLDGFGVQRIDPLGDGFDPARHEAITVVPVSEPSQDGIVCGVLAPGYLVGEDVLRPARVAVARHGGE
jgi:molecular chaperone GrpE